MCYAIPGEVTFLDGERATVDYGGVTKEANIALLDRVVIGDYVLVHAGFAIELLDRKSAKRAIEEIQSYIEAAESPDHGVGTHRAKTREEHPEGTRKTLDASLGSPQEDPDGE